MYLILFIALFNINQPNVDSQLLEQTNHYINEIDLENNLSENSWALLTAFHSSCNQSNTIQRLVSRSPVALSRKLLTHTTCGVEFPSIELITLIEEHELIGLALTLMIYNREHSDYVWLESSIINLFSTEVLSNYSPLLQKISAKQPIELKDIPLINFDLILNAIFYSQLEYFYPPKAEHLTILQKYRLEERSNVKIIQSLQNSNFIHFLYNTNRYIELSVLQEEVLLDRFFPIGELKISYANALAYAQNSIGRYDYSLELHREIIEPYSAYLGSKYAVDQSKFDQGVSLYLLGKFAEAKEIFETLFYDETSDVNKAWINNNLSISYEKLGQKNKYVKHLLDALDVAKDDTDYLTHLTILSNLYFYYSSIGDYKTALTYLQNARDIAVDANDLYQIATIRAITGMYYWQNENDVEKALIQFRIASQEFNPETNFDDYVRSNYSISDIYMEMDSLDAAQEVLKSLVELASKTSNTKAFIETTLGLLEIALLKSDLTSADNYFDILRLYSLDNLDFNTLVKYNVLAADFQFQSGDQRLAYQNLRPVIDQVLDRARTSIDTQTGFWVQEDEYIDAFNALLNILIAMGNELEAIQLLDEIKTINDAALYNSPILRANRLTESELARDQLLNSRIMDLRESFLYAAETEKRQGLKTQIDQLSAEREEILNKIRKNEVLKKAPIWMIQQNLAPNQQILHFTEVGNFLYVSNIANNQISLKRIDFESEEKALFTSVADQIALSKTDLNDLFEIYDFLGIENEIDFNKSSIIVVPDNYLYRIPLEILPINNPESSTSYGSATYLIEQFNIEYFASLQEYHSDTRNHSTAFSSDLSAFAISDFSEFEQSYLPTLPFAVEEIRTISNKLNSFDRKNLYLETNATKSMFLDEISNAKIVHIATHSEVSEQDPLFSTIYLNDQSAGSNIDAVFAYEMFDQRLNNELIMLNSCSSGSGDYLQGSGIMGITRALRYAGAKSMALNLWAVNDKVAYEFASVFYESLNNGESKSESMRNAKLSLLQNGNANPHYWGAFMLTGDPSPIIKRPDNAGLVFPILLLLIGSISIYLRRIYSI